MHCTWPSLKTSPAFIHQSKLLGQATHPLTELPQFLGRCVVAGFGVHGPGGAVGEVSSAQGLQALLHSTVQSSLGPLLWGLNEEAHDNSQKKHHQSVCIPGKFSFYGT